MGRAPNCKVCKTKLDAKTAYKVVVNGKNTYYCNEKEYLAENLKKKNKDVVMNLIDDIFGYKIINNLIQKEYNKWTEAVNTEKIITYLKENKEFLSNIMEKKDFSNEYGKIRYFSTILCNGLKDFKEKTKPDLFTYASKDEHYETKFKLKQRVSLEDLEDDCDE